MLLVPEGVGWRGNVARFIEANAPDYKAILDKVRGALETIFEPQKKWPRIEGLYPSDVVIEVDGHYWQYPYSVSEQNEVSFGAAVEVVQTFQPVGITNMTECVDEDKPDSLVNPGVFVEALDGEKGLKWRVRVIQAGMSGNRNFYSDRFLEANTDKFNGVRVFVKSDAEHLSGEGKSFNNLIGSLSNAEFVEANGTESAAVFADLTLLPSAGVHTKFMEARDANMMGLFGFSIDAIGRAKKVGSGRHKFIEALSWDKLKSVDLIVEPGAGGQLVEMLEAQKEETKVELEELIRLIESVNPALLDGVDRTSMDAVKTVFTECFREASASDETADTAPEEDGDQAVTRAEMQEALDSQRDYDRAMVAVDNCGLNDKAKQRLKSEITLGTPFTEAQGKISSMKELLADQGGGHIKLPLGGPQFSDYENGHEMLEAFFDPKNKDVRSFRECYQACTGDRHVSGFIKDCSRQRMTEALDSTSWSDALGEAIHKRMIDLYRTASIYDVWRIVADVVPVADFRTQERVMIGGYGDLQNVAESGAYGALASPTDSKESYAVSKKGGTEEITIEMIANDDVGAIQRIPQKLRTAAARTLSGFVLDMFVSNPLMGDGTAVFHATRNNLHTSALDGPTVSAHRLAMKRQKEPGSNADLMLNLRNLLVPAELEEAAYDLFKRDTNNDETFIQSLKPLVVPVWKWTDANDWVSTCDKDEHPIIELGFWRGQEEPELFIQDNPTQGSLFSHDKIIYKIRHVYGGLILSALGLQKSVVV